MSVDISIIIPVYNGAQCIQTAIESVQKQTVWKSRKLDYEIVVVDDASKDNIGEVVSDIRKRDSRVRLVRHDHNKGVSAARNTGANAARGEYLAFLDCDDIWKEKKLEAQLDVLDSPPFFEKEDVLVLSYFVGKIRQNGKYSINSVMNFLAGTERDEKGDFKNFRVFPNPLLEREIACGGIYLGAGSTLFAHRNAILKNGPFETSLRVGEDTEYLTRQVLAGRHIKVVPELMMVYLMADEGKYPNMDDYAKYMLKHYSQSVEGRFGKEAKTRFDTWFHLLLKKSTQHHDSDCGPFRPKAGVGKEQKECTAQ